MLSVLIPTYNYNITTLVNEINRQGLKCNVPYEILVYEDGSKSPINEINRAINAIPNCKFFELDKNIGRSAIRNLLGNEAKYPFLLFLDADVEIISDDFLFQYLNHLNAETQIIYGGICYQKESPKPDELLRWVYGKKREALPLKKRQEKPYKSFLTLNFLINKSLFSKIKFNEDIPNLRNEDLVFAMEAKKRNIKVEHIDNPVLHLGIDNSELFLEKTLETLYSFHVITSQGYLDPNDALITRVAVRIEKMKLAFIFKLIYKTLNKPLKNNLLSNRPSLFIFDLYRLCNFFEIKNKP